MGMLNYLITCYEDPKTHKKHKLMLQFKRGHCDLDDYRIGDKLKWSGRDRGVPGKRKVVVEAWNEESFHDKNAIVQWIVFIEDDVIVSVEPDTGQYVFSNPNDYGIVLEE
jgi:hypothetical protein